MNKKEKSQKPGDKPKKDKGELTDKDLEKAAGGIKDVDGCIKLPTAKKHKK